MTTLCGVVFAADDGQLLLGDDFFPWIALAFGAAMVVGNVLALLRPPKTDRGGTRSAGTANERPPIARVVAMIVLGVVVGGWGLASLVT
ncbi:MAG: hypothetical protein ACHQDC_01950 [Acidimicrobiales bacterium]|jgi:hypothetical protein